MPAPSALCRLESEGRCAITFAGRVLFCYDADDLGMRNMAVVAVTEAGMGGKETAAVFGLTPEYVSMLRGRARRQGSSGLVKRRGRPPKLTSRQVGRARVWAGEGVTQTEIARRLGVSRPVIHDVLDRLGPAWFQPALAEPAEIGVRDSASGDDESPGEAVVPERQPEPAGVPCVEPGSGRESGVIASAESAAGGAAVAPAGGAGVLGRLEGARVSSRYAGAMLLHAFYDRVGAAGVLAGVAGTDGVRFGDLAVLTATSLSFALGAGTLESTKHLIRDHIGPLAGITTLPQLRTLRPRLAQMADASDPLGLQRRLATAMIGADAPGMDLYFVDDHFVPYGGAKPVGKGWNNKRGRAERGLGDTLVTDYRGRAVAFCSGEPSGLSVTLPKALAELIQVTGTTKIMVGFDRGGAYPGVFTACREAGADWVTYRRGTLAASTATPRRCFHTGPDGITTTVLLADEQVPITDYGTARQITLFEGAPGAETPVLQVLTSDMGAPATALLAWLRCRWRIENVLKDLIHHYGMDWLCSYTADLIDDTRLIDNPARKTARAKLSAATNTLATAERALTHLLGSPDLGVAEKNHQIPTAEHAITTARAAVSAAEDELAAIPAKLPANQIINGAQRAILRTRRRGLQMVLRLLAFNAELWLADHLNAYLRDNNEYRAATRHLFHLDGTITYTRQAITVTLHRPQPPKLARSLALLIEEINTNPPRIPGDHRPITYTLTTP